LTDSKGDILKNLKITERTKVNRLPKRGSYDTETIYKILDASFVCHIGFKIENQVCIIPTLYGRKSDSIYIHGSKNSRMLKSFEAGEEVCISVTLIDGIVFARSAFHHSANYRSVIIFGKPEKIESSKGKNNALEIIFDHITPGRWNDTRQPNAKELNATSVYKFKIDEASAKIREGGAIDEKNDMDLNVWAGVLPLNLIPGNPERDKLLKKGIPMPGYIKNYRRKNKN
jgi:uncharacterized protein